MIGRDCIEIRAEQGVLPGRVYLTLRMAFRRGAGRQLPAQHQPLGAADPVGLHEPDLLGPAGEIIKRSQQFVRIIGNAQEPLRQLPLLDQRAGAPPASVDDLLVGENGLVHRVPIDLRRLARHEAVLEKIEEHVLLVAVVDRITGREFAAPVERKPHGFELAAHGCDVGVGPGGGMGLLFHRRIFGRHAKGVPAHRVKHGVAFCPAVARHHVAHRIIAHMAHVDAPRWIGKHLEDIIFRAGIVGSGLEHLPLGPDGLPAGFDFAEIVTARGGHRLGSRAGSRRGAESRNPEWRATGRLGMDIIPPLRSTGLPHWQGSGSKGGAGDR